jgi:hypothetical protein
MIDIVFSCLFYYRLHRGPLPQEDPRESALQMFSGEPQQNLGPWSSQPLPSRNLPKKTYIIYNTSSKVSGAQSQTQSTRRVEIGGSELMLLQRTPWEKI